MCVSHIYTHAEENWRGSGGKRWKSANFLYKKMYRRKYLNLWIWALIQMIKRIDWWMKIIYIYYKNSTNFISFSYNNSTVRLSSNYTKWPIILRVIHHNVFLIYFCSIWLEGTRFNLYYIVWSICNIQSFLHSVIVDLD